MKFTQRIRFCRSGTQDDIAPPVTITVEAEPGFPLSPDALSSQLGYFIAGLVRPNESVSIKSQLAPWPLPNDWTQLSCPHHAIELQGPDDESGFCTTCGAVVSTQSRSEVER